MEQETELANELYSWYSIAADAENNRHLNQIRTKVDGLAAKVKDALPGSWIQDIRESRAMPPEAFQKMMWSTQVQPLMDYLASAEHDTDMQERPEFRQAVLKASYLVSNRLVNDSYLKEGQLPKLVRGIANVHTFANLYETQK